MNKMKPPDKFTFFCLDAISIVINSYLLLGSLPILGVISLILTRKGFVPHLEDQGRVEVWQMSANLYLEKERKSRSTSLPISLFNY